MSASAAAFCGTCGWKLRAAICDACGADGTVPPAPAPPAPVFILAGPRPEDFPELASAFAAWRQKDFNRMVGQCITAAGVEVPQVTNLPTGPGWAFVKDSAAIFVLLHKQQGTLAIEAPIVRMSSEHRVPLMRMLLELNARALGASRFCLRGDAAVLRFADRMENLSPPKLVRAIREVAIQADRFDDLLSLLFQAPMLGPEARRQHLAFSALGTPVKLSTLKSAERAAALGPRLTPTSMPAVQATPPAPGQGPVAAAAEARLAAADALCDLLRGYQEVAKPFDFMKDVHPAVYLLLQRAALYRAHDACASSLPGAIAFLAEQAGPMLEQLWELPEEGLLEKAGFQAAKGLKVTQKVPSWAVLPMLFAKLIQTRGQAQGGAAWTPPPFSSSAEAKAHFKKYLAEVLKGPANASWRHFVLLGAFAELFSRVKLPPAVLARARAVVDASKATVTDHAVTELHAHLSRLMV